MLLVWRARLRAHLAFAHSRHNIKCSKTTTCLVASEYPLRSRRRPSQGSSFGIGSLSRGVQLCLTESESDAQVKTEPKSERTENEGRYKIQKKMSHAMAVTFLGTSSGGGPSDTRSCSSIALDLLGNGDLWLVDCAEGTLRQFMLQPERFGPRRLKTHRVTKIFITHLHFDHCMGIISLLANMLRGGPGAEQPPRTKPPAVELYGPAGLRHFVRSILKMTMTELTERYCVHELLSPSDTPTSSDASELHPGELPGRDILPVSTGLWFDFSVEGGIHVDAGPITHRAPCLGYVFREIDALQRKVVVLGDTSDASSLTHLAQNASLLIHEATDAYIPVEVDWKLRGDKKTPEMIKKKTVDRGHSTPAMAGLFAKAIQAERLVLNHFSAKFPAPIPHRRDRRRLVMGEIERQATHAWGRPGAKSVAATDFLRIEIPGAPVLSRFREPMMLDGEDVEMGNEIGEGEGRASGDGRSPTSPTFYGYRFGRNVLKRKITGERHLNQVQQTQQTQLAPAPASSASPPASAPK